MSRLTKIVFAVAIINAGAAVLFLTGLVDVSAVPGLYVTFPLAAVGYGMFVICLMLDKEVAKFDAEKPAQHDHAGPHVHPHNVEPLHAHDQKESMAA